MAPPPDNGPRAREQRKSTHPRQCHRVWSKTCGVCDHGTAFYRPRVVSLHQPHSNATPLRHDDARCAPMRGVQARLSIRARFLGGENGRTFPTACTAHCVPSDRVGAGLLHLEVVGWLEQRSGVMRVKRACQGVVGKFRQVCVHLQAAAEAKEVCNSGHSEDGGGEGKRGAQTSGMRAIRAESDRY